MAVLGTSIEWTDATWSPTRGCSRVSAGCDNCYAMHQAHRYDYPGGPYEGLTRVGSHGVDWSGRVRLVPEVLDEPLRWRKPQRIFVDSMSDVFHEALPDEAIGRVFTVMDEADRHTFQILTKRPARMLAFMTKQQAAWNSLGPLARGPLPNVWLGVSVEDQATADERIPLLLRTPATLHFVSQEPQLQAITHRREWLYGLCQSCGQRAGSQKYRGCCDCSGEVAGIDQLIVGGESGPKARPFDAAWARSVIRQCREARVACFVKQLGAQPYSSDERDRAHYATVCDRKGGDPSEWPEDLRVREFPA